MSAAARVVAVSVSPTWIDKVGVSVGAGNSLSKTSVVAGWTAGAASAEVLNGDGFAEMVMDATTDVMLGLSHVNGSESYDTIDFALSTNVAAGRLYIWESGTFKGSLIAYGAGDVCRVVLSSGQVLYQKNGVTFYTSLGTPTPPLLFDCSIFTIGGVLSGARLCSGAGVESIGAAGSVVRI